MKPQSKREELEAELKILQWHKLTNEAAIKAALLQNQTIKEQSSMIQQQSSTLLEDDSRWIQKVIHEERRKPLEVSRDFVLNLELQDKIRQNKLHSHVDKNMQSLKKIHDTIQERHKTQQRSSEYRQWRQDFKSKKDAVMSGKILENAYPKSELFNSEKILNASIPVNNNHLEEDLSRFERLSHNKADKDLSHVVESLNKLSELENRIASLESGIKRGNGSKSFSTNFQKSNKYFESSLNVLNRSKKKSNNVDQSKASEIRDGFFITEGVQNYQNDRDSLRRERQLKLSKASEGQKNLRSRIIDKKTKEKEASLRSIRHKEALKELSRRKQEKLFNPSNVKKGASSGIRTNNAYLSEVKDLRAGFQRRKDTLQQKLKSGSGINGLKSIGTGSFSAPSQMQHDNAHTRAPITNTFGANTIRTGSVSIPLRRRLLSSITPKANTIDDLNPIIGINGLRSMRKQK